jgi:hypothetical protein
VPVVLFQPFVDFREGKLRLGAGNREAALVGEITPVPSVVLPAEVVLYPSAVLGDDEVRTEAGHTLVGGKLLAPVRGLGAWRRYLYHQTQVVFDKRVVSLGTAGDHQVRIIDNVVSDVQLDALRVHPASAATRGPPETAVNVADDPVVPLRSADHREDLTAHVLVSDRGRLFELQILIDGQR